jgi:hypothetical protein
MSQKEIISISETNHGMLWEAMDDKNYFQLIHFDKLDLLNLGNNLEEEYGHRPHRGRSCSLTPFDDLALYLMYLSTRESQERMSILLHMDSSVVSNSLSRVRPVLQKVLAKMQPSKPKWSFNKTNAFPECPYLVDGTSIGIPKPCLPFSEAKKYYNVHHKLYSMNVEVLMMRDNVFFF